MAIGRISGSVLKSNLTRNGVDLAFETNLLYLDVTNSRVGIGTSEPTTALQVNGTTTTTGLTASGAIAANGSGNSITVADTLRIAQSGSGLRMTNVGAFDNDGSDNFRIFSTNDLILSSNGDSNTALTIDGTTQDVTINQDLGVTGTVTATAFAGDGSQLTGINVDTNIQIVGDDSTGATLGTGETFKIAGGTNVTTAVSGDTLTITGPDLTSYITASSTDTFTNKSISLTNNTLSGTTAEFNSALSDGSFATLAGTETLTNKTLTTPIISSISNTGTLTLPTNTDTLVGRDTTDTLTNKTLTSAVLNTGVSGTAVLDEDNMASDSDTQLATQQSIKAYVNTQVGAVSTSSISQGNSDVTVTDSGTGAITVSADGNSIITMNATTVLDASATTNAVRLPNGTTAQRPSGSVGMIRYNSSTDTIEGYTTAGGWAQLGATSSIAENTNDTTTNTATAISTTASVIDQFVTTSFDSAWYLAVTRDEINNEVSTAKYSLVHNDTDAFVSESHVTQSNVSNTYVSVTADVVGGNARLLGTGGSVVNSVSFYRIATGDNTIASTTGNVTTTINLDVDSAAEKIDGFALASARGAKYYISVNNTTTGEVSNTEAMVVHDGSTAYINQYGNVNSGNNDLITLTAEVDSTEVVVKASAQAPNCRVTVYRILLADDESASTGDNINVVEATTVDSGATTVDSFATSAYTGAFYVFTGYNAAEGAASIQEVMVVANDEAYITQGPMVSTKESDQLTFTASLSGTNVTVKASSTSGASTIVNGYRVHMLRGSAGASTADTVLVSTEQTITGAKTFASPIALTVGSDPTTVVDKAHIYAKDEAASAEVFVRDEAGNVTKISPHNEAGEWEYYSRNVRTGKTVRINMEEMIRDIEKLTGKTYIKND
jgi:hypothetical protein